MASSNRTNDGHWYGVRCLFTLGDAIFEERITVWRAENEDHAIQLAEEEAARYSEDLADSPSSTEYVGLAQCYQLYDEPGTSGAEVFSLIRDSDLMPQHYINRYFATGDEHERTPNLRVPQQPAAEMPQALLARQHRRRHCALMLIEG